MEYNLSSTHTSIPFFDIAVVGSGPAASTFARAAANVGLSLVLIDGHALTGPKPCGGLLSPDAQKFMARHDFVLPTSLLADPQIFSVRTIDLVSGLDRSYQRYYLNMNRQAFDDFLLSLLPTQVMRLEARLVRAESSKMSAGNRSTSGRQTRFRLTLRDKEKALSFLDCRFLIGADGASSLVRRTFFRERVMKYQAIQQWFPLAEDVACPHYSCLFDKETSESCSWIIRKDGFLIYGGCFARTGARASFEKQKQRVWQRLALPPLEPLRTEACLAARPRKVSDFVTGRDGVYLIGEAASFISPSSFEGISYAMESASRLASVFDRYAPSIRTSGSQPDPALDRRIEKAYRKASFPLRAKLLGKIIKHDLIFHPFVRKLIMKSGLTALDPIETK